MNKTLTIFLLLASLVWLYSSFASFTKRRRRIGRQDWFLGLSIGAFALSVSSYMLGSLSVICVRYHPGMLIPFTFATAMSPLLYFYVRESVGKRVGAAEIFLHHIPFALLLLDVIMGYASRGRMLLFPAAAVTYFSLVQTLAYTAMCLYKFRGYLKTESQQQRISRRGKRIMHIILLKALAFLALIEIAVFNVFGTAYLSLSLKFASAICIYLVNYYQEYKKVMYLRLVSPADEEQQEKYRYSKLTDGEREIILKRLHKFMLAEEVYLDPDLRIRDLADKIKVSSHYLSQVINEEYQQSFPEYINTFRIEKAVSLLDQSDKQPVINEIAFLSGFNNKVSFNTKFKKQTGYTPTEYYRRRKSLRKAM